MKNILDLRFIIALFFGVTGVILVIASLLMHTDSSKTEATNLWSGLFYITFSIIMFILWKISKPETEEDSSSDE